MAMDSIFDKPQRGGTINEGFLPGSFHHSKLPDKGPFTAFCAIFLDVYEIPFPGIILPSSPWIGGYTASPILYCLYACGVLALPANYAAFLKPWGPQLLPKTFLLTTDADWTAVARMALLGMYVFHFVRRLYESVFVNTYTGKTRRLSDVELSYYVCWGVLCGASGSAALTSEFGVVAPRTFAFGAVVWAAGQAGNAYCHALLERLKKKSKGHAIPYDWPFNLFVMPHYTAEMTGWAGFAICSGLNTASLTIWGLSLCVLQIWTHSRRLQYIKMHKDGQIPKDQYAPLDEPKYRWGVLPGLEYL